MIATMSFFKVRHDPMPCQRHDSQEAGSNVKARLGAKLATFSQAHTTTSSSTAGPLAGSQSKVESMYNEHKHLEFG